MELRHLRHLIALSEEGSFTKAAARTNTVQSGLSASIKDLEQELGSQLVERTTRKIRFTESGNLFLQHARTTLAALESGIEQVQSMQNTLRGHLRLGILQSLGPYLDLPLVLQKFREAHPLVEVSVRAVSTDSVPALIRSGELDLSFHALQEKSDWPGVDVLPFAVDKLVAVSSKDHPLKTLKQVALQRLAQEAFVDVTPERALRQIIDKAFARAKLRRNIAFEVSDVPTALDFVERGLGVAIVPRKLAQCFSPNGALSITNLKPSSEAFPQWKIAIVKRPTKATHSEAAIPKTFLQAMHHHGSVAGRRTMLGITTLSGQD